MIFTEKKITITNNQCNIDSPIILYRGDYNVEIRFTIISSPHKYSNKQDTNIVESTEASYGQLVIRRPNNTAIFSEIAATKRGAIIFTITAEMIDEITEVGNYTFQIRLLDENKESRVTIPEVVNGIEIREPIAIEDVTDTNEVDVATVGYAMTTAGTTEDAFDSQGNYNKTAWRTGDRITAAKLDKIEAGIDGVNKKVASGGSGSNINDTTASATTTYSSNKIENIKEDLNSQIRDIDLSNYVEKVEGKGLSTNDYTTAEKEKLSNLNENGFTDEQISNAIQAKIDDGSLSSLSIAEGSLTENLLTDELQSKINNNAETETGEKYKLYVEDDGQTIYGRKVNESIKNGLICDFDMSEGSGDTLKSKVGNNVLNLSNFADDGTDKWVNGGLKFNNTTAQSNVSSFAKVVTTIPNTYPKCMEVYFEFLEGFTTTLVFTFGDRKSVV